MQDDATALRKRHLQEIDDLAARMKDQARAVEDECRRLEFQNLVAADEAAKRLNKQVLDAMAFERAQADKRVSECTARMMDEASARVEKAIDAERAKLLESSSGPAVDQRAQRMRADHIDDMTRLENSFNESQQAMREEHLNEVHDLCKQLRDARSEKPDTSQAGDASVAGSPVSCHEQDPADTTEDERAQHVVSKTAKEMALQLKSLWSKNQN